MTQEIDDLSRAALAELFGVGESANDNAPPAETGNPPPVAPAPDAAKSEAAKEAGSDKEPAFISRALKRVSEREQAVAKRERDLAAKEKQPNETKPAAWSKAAQRARLSEYLKAELGLDPADAARALMTEALGDKAPPEYRQIASQLKDRGTRDEEMESLRAEIAELRGQHQARSNAQAVEEYRAGYLRSLEQHVTGDLSGSPRAAKFIAKNRARALGEMQRIVAADAAQKLQSGDSDARPMTPAEVISALENYLADFFDAEPVKAEAPTERKTLASATPAPAPPRDLSSLDAAAKEADDWLAKHLGR